MATFKIKTKNAFDIGKKPRVYFTCHPDDFDKYFEKICADIFKTHDCSIYYTEDMREAISDDEKETDLGRMNLFVVPVTYKLLFQPNRAMDGDIAYAKNEHIPILPIMMESGIDAVYSNPDKFGERQYLNPYSRDLTEISYEEKLKKHLEAVLISNEMAAHIRAEFDAYIFLSYRKKDRKYANRLMRIIHSNPECRDIAIWFDEFLIPGESFKTNIKKALSDSKLFTLLVTPNILEYHDDGTPNFIMEEEYPAAHDLGIEIVPAEMEETDKILLADKFNGIPECIRVGEDNFNEQFIETIAKVSTKKNNTSEHDFLIGLAYLDGIDVEVNRALGIELITKSAEAGYINAILKLYLMYSKGEGVIIDYNKALKWATALYNKYCEEYGAEHPDTLTSLSNLASSYGNVGNYRKKLELCEKVYALRIKILGEEHSDTLISLNNLAHSYYTLDNYEKSLELHKKAYILRSRIFGEEHPDTLQSLTNLANAYSKVGEHKKSLELSEKVYSLRIKILGEEHPDTVISLNNLAMCYYANGDCSKSLKLIEKAYSLSCKTLGEEHPNTIMYLSNLAELYIKFDNCTKALELNKKVYASHSRILGVEHPDTLQSLDNLAFSYYKNHNYGQALILYEKLYHLYVKKYGEKSPKTMRVIEILAKGYDSRGEFDKAIYYFKKLRKNSR